MAADKARIAKAQGMIQEEVLVGGWCLEDTEEEDET